MKFGKLGAMLVGAVLGLAACGGGSVCDDAASGIDAYNQKASACPDEQASQIDTSACDSALSNCSDADKTAISNYYKCLGDVQACVAGQEADFEQQVVDCAENNLANVTCGFGG